MSEIQIPFSREMAIAAIESRKCATTRSEQKGKVGDTFEIWHPDVPKNEAAKYFGIPKFRIIGIFPVDLMEVSNRFFRLEGFDSPELFEKTWRALHRGHFSLDKTYFIHFFARLP